MRVFPSVSRGLLPTNSRGFLPSVSQGLLPNHEGFPLCFSRAAAHQFKRVYTLWQSKGAAHLSNFLVKHQFTTPNPRKSLISNNGMLYANWEKLSMVCREIKNKLLNAIVV
jgi:hypothetical protein